MQKTFHESPLNSLRRGMLWRSALVASAGVLSVAACESAEPTAPPDGTVAGSSSMLVGGAGGRTGTGGTTSSGGSVTTGGTGGTTSSGGTGGTSAVGGSGGTGGSGAFAGTGAASGTGGSSAGSGGSGGGTGGTGGSSGGTGGTGMSSGGMSSGGMGGKPCVDVEPPPDPNWPGATCTNWANETSECTADWFKDYCDVSCKRCVPQGGTGGSGGGAGSGSGGGAGAAATDCSKAGLPQVTGGDGYATRYWDCCQTHCSQFDGHKCGQDDTSRTSDTNSSCNGGGSYACYDEAPKAVNDCLSYGYIAKANPNCGGCYRIQFTGQGQYNNNDPGSQAIKGKQMIVKVSNTGGDVATNQFDMMIPGGGVGKFNACSKEWGTSDLGAQYGGFLTNCSGDLNAKKECVRQACMKIPAGAARDGCIWFVDWMQVADNPKFTSQATDCPF